MARNLVNFYGAALTARLSVVHNGVDPPFALSPARKQSSDNPTIVSAGRVIPQKGLEELLASAGAVLHEFPTARYIHYGSVNGKYERALLAEINDERVTRALSLRAMCTREEVQMAFCNADVVLIPSCYEPFGYTALEAMLMGSCVIASARGGMPEFIENGKTGLLVPGSPNCDGVCLDVKELSRLQIAALTNRSQSTQIGAAGQSYVRAHHNRRIMTEQILTAYREMLAGTIP